MTPYGYKIVRGKAVIDPEKAQHVRIFFNKYLQGLPVSKASKESGIELCTESARLMLGKEVYTGDDYYPAIISKDTFIRAGQEQERRKEKTKRGTTAKPREAVPVKTRFRVCVPRTECFADFASAAGAEKRDDHNGGEKLHASEKAALLYRFIRPDVNGNETISADDRERIREYLADRLSGSVKAS